MQSLLLHQEGKQLPDYLENLASGFFYNLIETAPSFTKKISHLYQ